MSDNRTGLSSFGEQLLYDALDKIEALVGLADEERFKKAHAAAVEARVSPPAEGPADPVTQADVDRLMAQVDRLSDKLAAQHAARDAALGGTSSPGVAPAPATEPSISAAPGSDDPGPRPSPGGSNAFPDQPSMVPQPGPTP